MDDCLFCKIIKETIPSYTIYEDEKVKVFMDINPTTNGHLLVIPKSHRKNLFDVEEETLSYMLKIIREKLYPLLKEHLGIDGLTISQNNDYGQEVKHLHIHVIPRYKNDDFPLSSKSAKENIEEIYEKLKNNGIMNM